MAEDFFRENDFFGIRERRQPQGWIIHGGHFLDAKVAGESEDLKCEISPLVSYDGEDRRRLLGRE